MITITAAHAQDASALDRQTVSTNSPATVTVDLKAQPSVPWADHMAVSGLFVDLIKPEQTWSLFNPATPAPTVAPPPLTLQNPTPVTISDRDSDIKNGGPNLVFLRFSFP